MHNFDVEQIDAHRWRRVATSSSLHRGAYVVTHYSVRIAYFLLSVALVMAVNHLTGVRIGRGHHAKTDMRSAALRPMPLYQQRTPPGQHTLDPTCDGNLFLLHCPNDEVIVKVNAAFYGRMDGGICPHQSMEFTMNTKCSLATATQEVALGCVGQASCAPPGPVGYSKDPCPGTYKYATATYTCGPRSSLEK